MTKQEWDKKCKLERDAAWNAAHPPDREAAKHTAAIAARSEVVFARFMARDAADKRVRCEALVSHSVNGLANSTAWLDAITEYRFAVMAAWNASQTRMTLG